MSELAITFSSYPSLHLALAEHNSPRFSSSFIRLAFTKARKHTFIFCRDSWQPVRRSIGFWIDQEGKHYL